MLIFDLNVFFIKLLCIQYKQPWFRVKNKINGSMSIYLNLNE